MSHRQRRTLVNLSVFAGSAAMFATAWLGVVGADRTSPDSSLDYVSIPETTTGSAAVAQLNTIPAFTAAAPASDATLTQPAPTPAPRRVVVVRQSRAS